jgi:superkiller protein 3
MHLRNRILGLALILALVATGAAFAAGEGRMLGTVIDEEGNPIQGVKVTVTSPDLADFEEVKTTNKKGQFSVVFAKAYLRYLYRFEKEGYATRETETKTNISGTTRQDFTLHFGQAPTATAGSGANAAAAASNAAIFTFNEGVDAYKAGEFALALEKFNAAIEKDPSFPQAHTALAELHYEMGNYQEAVTEAETAIAQSSGELNAMRVLYDANRKLGNEDAAKEAQAALAAAGQATEEAKKIYNEGVGLHKAGDFPAALARFEEAVAMDPNLVAAYNALTTVTMQMEDWEKAGKYAEKLLELEPGHENALRIRYDAYVNTNQIDKLDDALLDLAVVDKDFAATNLYNQGIAFYNDGNIAAAREWFEKSLTVDPDYARAHYYLGLSYISEGANDKAKERLERFIALAPDDPEVATAKEMMSYLQ